jgi:EmrB/QacA subfamily drug resistance transporter
MLNGTRKADLEVLVIEKKGTKPKVSGGGTEPSPLRWWALVVLSLVQFVLVLDATVVNVALPSIERDLGMGPAGLAWVVNGYALAFGGLLLLGGRLADLFGRRRVFLAGLGVFALASAAAGLSLGPETLVAGRFLQGAGAALVAPAALSMVTLLFSEEKERATALSIWGGLAGLGATVGVLLGGVLSDLASWPWVFLINLPVAAVALALVPRLVAESRSSSGGRGRLDVPGALLVTAGLSLVVFALLGKGAQSWASGAVLVPLACGFALVGLFVAAEARAENPLVPLRFFRSGIRSAANAIFVLTNGAMMAMYFSLSLYMQQVLGFSALLAGLAYLPLCAAFFVGIGASSRLVRRFGARTVITGGLTVAAAGLALLSGVSADGSYLRDLLPGMLVVPLGAGAAFVAATILALEGTDGKDAGLASGVLNTAQQVGNALGLAVLVSLAVDRTSGLLSAGAEPSVAATGGFSLAFGAAAGVLFAAGLLAFFVIRSRVAAMGEDGEPVGETR